MAESTQVKQYLAYWFQLGKRVIVPTRSSFCLPKEIFQGDRYAPEFEECWALITAPQMGDCYLEGTTQTIKQLLSPQWEITNCARCFMPVPTLQLGIVRDPSCVCDDLNNWPNNQLPTPRSPINNHQKLTRIQKSLDRKYERLLQPLKKEHSNNILPRKIIINQ